MESLRAPLIRVNEAMQRFVEMGSPKLVHVRASADMRIAILEQIAVAEHHPRNRAPFFILEAPWTAEEDGWAERCEELRADMEHLRSALAGASEPIGLEPMPEAAKGRTDLERFALELSSALAICERSGSLQGLVIVLAPLEVQSPKDWRENLRTLIRQKKLSGVRWILIDMEGNLDARSLRKFDVDFLVVDGHVDLKEAQREMHAMLGAAASSPTATFGRVGPRVAAPPRKSAPADPTPEMRHSAAAGVDLPPSALEPEFMDELRQRILTAANRMASGDALGAIEAQAEAVALSDRAGLKPQTVQLRLVLGGYLLQMGAKQKAVSCFEQCRIDAEREGLGDQAVQSEMARGSALLLSGRREEAVAAYAAAGQIGAGMGAKTLAIEAYRMAGQLLLELKREEDAIRALLRAIELAEGAESVDLLASTAPEAARQLAAICRKRRMFAQAESLEAQAEALSVPPYAADELPELPLARGSTS